MALPTTNITTSLVSSTIGISSKNVGVLCTSSAINKWSHYKPYVIDNTSCAKLNGVIPYPTGFYVKQDSTSIPNKTVYYLEFIKWSDFQEYFEYGYFSLGDFRGYDHNAQPAGIYSNNVLVQATPGLNVNVRIVLNYNDVEYAINTIQYEEINNYLQPNVFVIGSNVYDMSELNALTENTIEEEINSIDVMWEAPYLFESIINFRTQYTTPFFMDAYQNKIYFNLQDAIVSENNTIDEQVITPSLTIPTYFNNCYKDGSNYYKNGMVFRDCPIRPKVYIDGILQSRDNFFFRNISLKALESYEGLPEHYAIYGDFYNTVVGDYFATVTLKLYDVDWTVRNVLTPEIESTYEYEYGYNSNPNDGSIPALPLIADNFYMSLNGYSSQSFSFILNEIPFKSYSSYFGNAELGYERVNQQGVEVILNFYSA